MNIPKYYYHYHYYYYGSVRGVCVCEIIPYPPSIKHNRFNKMFCFYYFGTKYKDLDKRWFVWIKNTNHKFKKLILGIDFFFSRAAYKHWIQVWFKHGNMLLLNNIKINCKSFGRVGELERKWEKRERFRCI